MSRALDSYVEQVHSSPDVYKITAWEEGERLPISNSYLIKGQKRSLLIDTCVSAPDLMKKALVELGAGLSRVSIFLTHMDCDHAGNLKELSAFVRKVYVGREEVEATACRDYEETKSMYRANGFSLEEADRHIGMYRAASLNLDVDCPYEFVQDGDVIDLEGLRFRVIATFGHTAGHLSLYESSSGLLFGGDALLYGMTPSVGFNRYNRGMMSEALDSLARLSDLRVDVLMPGHGDVVYGRDSVRMRAEELRGHYLSKLDNIIKISASGEVLSGMDIIVRMKWGARAGLWEDLNPIQQAGGAAMGLCFIMHLVDVGVLRRIETSDGRRLYELADQILKPLA